MDKEIVDLRISHIRHSNQTAASSDQPGRGEPCFIIKIAGCGYYATGLKWKDVTEKKAERLSYRSAKKICKTMSPNFRISIEPV